MHADTLTKEIVIILQYIYISFCLQAGVENKIDLRIQPALKTLGTVIHLFS